MRFSETQAQINQQNPEDAPACEFNYSGLFCVAKIHCIINQRDLGLILSLEICFVLNLCLRSKEKFLLNLLTETVKITPKHIDRSAMLQVN